MSYIRTEAGSNNTYGSGPLPLSLNALESISNSAFNTPDNPVWESNGDIISSVKRAKKREKLASIIGWKAVRWIVRKLGVLKY